MPSVARGRRTPRGGCSSSAPRGVVGADGREVTRRAASTRAVVTERLVVRCWDRGRAARLKEAVELEPRGPPPVDAVGALHGRHAARWSDRVLGAPRRSSISARLRLRRPSRPDESAVVGGCLGRVGEEALEIGYWIRGEPGSAWARDRGGGGPDARGVRGLRRRPGRDPLDPATGSAPCREARLRRGGSGDAAAGAVDAFDAARARGAHDVVVYLDALRDELVDAGRDPAAFVEAYDVLRRRHAARPGRIGRAALARAVGETATIRVDAADRSKVVAGGPDGASRADLDRRRSPARSPGRLGEDARDPSASTGRPRRGRSSAAENSTTRYAMGIWNAGARRCRPAHVAGLADELVVRRRRGGLSRLWFVVACGSRRPRRVLHRPRRRRGSECHLGSVESAAMAYEFKLPDLGEGLTEGEIARWLVDRGPGGRRGRPARRDPDRQDDGRDPLARGRDVSPGSSSRRARSRRSARCSSSSATTARGRAAGKRPAAASPPRPSDRSAGARSRDPARPAARAGARRRPRGGRRHGPGGRVTEEDVAARRGGGTARRRRGPGRREPLRGVRRRIVEHLTTAHREIPAVTFVEECDFTGASTSAGRPDGSATPRSRSRSSRS